MKNHVGREAAVMVCYKSSLRHRGAVEDDPFCSYLG